MADNISRDDLKDAMTAVFRQGQQSAGAKQQAGGPGAGADILKTLTEGAKLTGSAFSALAAGGNNFGSVLGATGAQLGKFGKLGELAGGALSYVGKYAQESVDAMRNFGKFGASFGGDAMDMRVQIAGTRMSLEEYGKTLNKNRDLLTSMGGSVDRGAVQFNRFSKEFFDSDASERLRMLGMTSEEINGALAIELASRRFSNMEDAKSREAARASAEAMATEMDKIAKQTGKSREAQQEELTALQRDGKFQAAIRLQMMNGNKFAAEGIQAAMTQMNKFGAPVQNLMKDLVSFGTAQKDTAGIMAALGPAGTQLQTAMAAVKGAKTEEQKAAAQAQLRAAERAVEEQLMSRQFNENAALGIRGFQDVANSTTNLTQGLDKIAATEGLDLNKAADRAKAIAIRDRQIAESQATQQGKPGTQAAPGKATTDAVIKLEQTLGNATAAVQKQVVDRLNNEIAPGMKKFADSLGGPTGKFGRENQEATIKSGINDIVKAVNSPIETGRGAVGNAQRGAQEDKTARDRARDKALAEGRSPEAAEAAGRAAEQQSRDQARSNSSAVTNPFGALFTNSQPGVVTVVPGRATGTIGETGAQRAVEGAERERARRESAQGGVTNPLGGLFTNSQPGVVTVVPGRATGTIGETGQLFEPKAFFGMLHKGETIFTPDQLMNFAKNAQGTGIETAISSLSSAMQTGTQGPAGPAGSAGSALPGGFNIANFSTPVTAIAEMFNTVVAEGDKIAAQTQSFLSSQKSFAESTLKNISLQLSNLDDQKDNQQLHTINQQLHTISLNTEVEILKNKKIELAELNRRDQLDIEHSQRQIALYREMIDQAQSADEVTDLQTKLALEEQDLSDAKFDLAMRQQAILDTDADISLKEQQLYDAREELANTESAQAKSIEPKSGKDAYSSVLDKFFGPMAGPNSTVTDAAAGKPAAAPAAALAAAPAAAPAAALAAAPQRQQQHQQHQQHQQQHLLQQMQAAKAKKLL